MKNKLLYTTLTILASLFVASCSQFTQPTHQPEDDKPPIVNPAPIELDSGGDHEDMKPSPEWGIDDLSFDSATKILTFCIENRSKDTVQYSLRYDLERIGRMGDWIETGATDDLSFIEIMVEIGPGEKNEDSIDLTPLNLTTGTYKLVRKYMVGSEVYLGIITFSVDELMVYDYFESGVSYLEPLS